MGQDVLVCIECAFKGLACDQNRPSCGLCESAIATTCSYEWVVDNPQIYTLFPAACDYNRRVLPFAPEDVVGRNFGGTYRAALREGGYVSIKRLFTDYTTTGTAILLPLQHARTWSQLNHTHIVPFLGVANFKEVSFCGRRQLCLVSPWFGEGNIMHYTTAHPEIDILPLLLDAVEGLRYLHERELPIIHASLRGCNILIEMHDKKPRALLADIGVSRVQQSFNLEYEQSSTMVPPFGRPRWLAFERVTPWKFGLKIALDAESVLSDVFELLRTFLEVLSGRQPFYYNESDHLVERTLVWEGQNPERPSEANPKLDDAMWELMQRGWSNEVAKRPTLSEIQVFLQDAIAREESKKVGLEHPVAIVSDTGGAHAAGKDSPTSLSCPADREQQDTTKVDMGPSESWLGTIWRMMLAWIWGA